MSYPVIHCAHCNQPGHKANRCKELGIPPDGEIIKPLPGQNDVDDCDDSIVIPKTKQLSGQKRSCKQIQNFNHKKYKQVKYISLTINKRAEP
jgi:hypothetical protein